VAALSAEFVFVPNAYGGFEIVRKTDLYHDCAPLPDCGEKGYQDACFGCVTFGGSARI